MCKTKSRLQALELARFLLQEIVWDKAIEQGMKQPLVRVLETYPAQDSLMALLRASPVHFPGVWYEAIQGTFAILDCFKGSSIGSHSTRVLLTEQQPNLPNLFTIFLLGSMSLQEWLELPELDLDAARKAWEERTALMHRTSSLVGAGARGYGAESDQQGRPPFVVLQGSGIGPTLSAEQGRRQMERIGASSPPWMQAEFTAWLRSDSWSADEVVAAFDINQATLAEWIATNNVIALRDVEGELRFPIHQFDQLGPVEGLNAIADHFPSPEVTWDFLVSPCRMFEMRPPIDALRDGQVNAVKRVALAVSLGDFF